MEKHPEIQFLPREEIKLYQEKRLTETLEYLAAKSPFYQRQFRDNGIDKGVGELDYSDRLIVNFRI